MKYILFSLILTLVGCATAPQSRDRVLIVTNNDYFIGQEVDLKNISKILNKSDHVLLSANHTTTHERVKAALKECAEAGITNITYKTSE